MLRLSTTLKNTDTYHYTVLARKLIEAGRVSPTPVVVSEAGRVGLTLVLVVEDVEVVVIAPVGDKDIGNEFQDRGLPGTSLSNEKDGVWCFRLIRRTLDDPLLDRLYVTGK